MRQQKRGYMISHAASQCQSNPENLGFMLKTPATSTASPPAALPRSRNTGEPAGIHQPGKTASPATHVFRYVGRRWRIYKRTTAPDAPWYIQFYQDRERFPVSLRTAAKASAELEAKSHIDAWLAKARDARAGTRRNATQFATIGQVLDALPTLSIKANHATREAYALCLRLVLSRALALDQAADIKPLSCALLGDQTAAKYFAAMEVAAAACATQVEALRLRRSWLSQFNVAKSMFAPRAEYQLRTVHGLALPDLRGWQTAVKIHGPQKLPKAAAFQRPDDAILRRTLREWVKLGQTRGYRVIGCEGDAHGDPLTELDRRNMFIAIGLELSCGLRKSETLRVRWDWIKTFSGIPHVSSRDTTAKDSSGEIHVVPLDPYWRHLLRVVHRNGWRGAPAETLLIARPRSVERVRGLLLPVGGPSDREIVPFDLIGRWLRSLGWQTQKTNHALRDWSASLITMKYGLQAAAGWCRHKQMTTTQSHYNRFVELAAQVKPITLAWFKWAK